MDLVDIHDNAIVSASDYISHNGLKTNCEYMKRVEDGKKTIRMSQIPLFEGD